MYHLQKRHEDPTSQHNYLTSDCRKYANYIRFRVPAMIETKRNLQRHYSQDFYEINLISIMIYMNICLQTKFDI